MDHLAHALASGHASVLTAISFRGKLLSYKDQIGCPRLFIWSPVFIKRIPPWNKSRGKIIPKVTRFFFFVLGLFIVPFSVVRIINGLSFLDNVWIKNYVSSFSYSTSRNRYCYLSSFVFIVCFFKPSKRFCLETLNPNGRSESSWGQSLNRNKGVIKM